MCCSEKVLGRGSCSSSIDYNRIYIDKGRLVKPYNPGVTYSDSDVFKNITKVHQNEFFATIRARMEATSSKNFNDTSNSFDDQYVNAPLISKTKKTHFDYDEVCFVFV